VGTNTGNPDESLAELKNSDLTNKIVILPGDPLPGQTALYRDKGAAGVLTIIPQEMETIRAEGKNVFERTPRGRMTVSYETQQRGSPASSAAQNQAQETPRRPSLPFVQAAIGHDLAASILGVKPDEVADMVRAAKRGEPVPGKILAGTRVNLTVEMETRNSTSRNIIALIPGSDPVLKNEYIVICAHHDHLGIVNGSVIAGADDNGTGTVALIGIARALLTERPKRSVIIAWFTGEEQGMYGSHFFVNNCPVPVGKISTCLNLDMLGRNNSDSLYLVGSNLLSSELDASIQKVNKQSGIRFGFDYLYSNLTHPQRVYFRSDHYPFIRFGIPSVWFFCGFTPDYHTPKDVLEYIDYQKFLKITKLTYLTAFDIGNKKNLLELDVNPEVTTRGKQNLTTRSLY
jgi:hypothetical protein